MDAHLIGIDLTQLLVKRKAAAEKQPVKATKAALIERLPQERVPSR